MNLKGFRRRHLRLRLGIAFVRFGIRVSGMGCEIEGPSGDAADDEHYGGEKHLTERGKEAIGTLREMRARDDPRLRRRPASFCRTCRRE